jgi:hypothetical protein
MQPKFDMDVPAKSNARRDVRPIGNNNFRPILRGLSSHNDYNFPIPILLHLLYHKFCPACAQLANHVDIRVLITLSDIKKTSPMVIASVLFSQIVMFFVVNVIFRMIRVSEIVIGSGIDILYGIIMAFTIVISDNMVHSDVVSASASDVAMPCNADVLVDMVGLSYSLRFSVVDTVTHALFTVTALTITLPRISISADVGLVAHVNSLQSQCVGQF